MDRKIEVLKVIDVGENIMFKEDETLFIRGYAYVYDGRAVKRVPIYCMCSQISCQSNPELYADELGVDLYKSQTND